MKMANLWYGSDEVSDYHPIVESCLNKALVKAKLENKYVIKHHYGQFTSGIPDFALLDKKTNDFVCIIEVKKTPSDVFYFGSGYQTKSYVDELFPLRWKPNHHPHFCVTNIEITQFFCWRKGASLIGCLLTGSPHDCGQLEDGQKCFDRFIDSFSNYFISIDKLKEPEFSMCLEAISESFNETFYTISKILGVNLVRINRLLQAGDQIKESIIYELLRFAFYYYIKEIYQINKSPYHDYFKEFNVAGQSNSELLKTIETNFSTAMEIDFKDILKNYNNPGAIIPGKLQEDKELQVVFSNFIKTLNDNAALGIRKNNSLMQFVSLLTSEIYDKEEMHSLGKIMSDEMLSNILAKFAITSKDDLVIDPCCGDGNLLISAYNRLRSLYPKSSHNKLLSQIYGVEIDANLMQLAAFKLVCNNLAGVDKNTVTYLQNEDLFDMVETEKFDALVMNPPFLRNEDVADLIKEKYLKNIEVASKAASFIRNVAQPNLYFYFIEKSISLLKNDGRASIILMTKFLNNKDGAFLKSFLVPHLKAIISYPPNFFRGFAVTTCIILLQKNSNNKRVAFLRIKDTNLLSDLMGVNEIIESDENKDTDKYSVVHIPSTSLNPSQNWRLYLIDPNNKFSEFEKIQSFQPITHYFDIMLRGKADNCGGSSVIYPYSSNNPLSSQVEQIEPQFIGFGMQRNKIEGGRRKIILTSVCLNVQKGILFPSKYDTTSKSGVSNQLPNSRGLINYCNAMSDLKIKGEQIDVPKVMNSAFSSIVTPQLLIPRADREKHIVYFNPYETKPVLLSTNFFSLSGFMNQNPKLDVKKQLLFITAFLNSVYGQIQFEIHANNQEGMRKLEGFMIEKLRVPDLNALTQEELENVVDKLVKLNSMNIDYLGIESENPRRELDLAIAKILYRRNKMGFDSPEHLNEHFEDFLKDIVIDRTNNK